MVQFPLNQHNWGKEVTCCEIRVRCKVYMILASFWKVLAVLMARRYEILLKKEINDEKAHTNGMCGKC